MSSSNASTSSNPNPRKRIRIPLSCSFCRAKKKKCDKKRPKCTYCVQHFNADCHYEYEPLSSAAYSLAASLLTASASVGLRDYPYSHNSNSKSSNNFNTFSSVGPGTSAANSGNGNVHGIVQQNNANNISRFNNFNPLIARENSINSNNSSTKNNNNNNNNNIDNTNHTSSKKIKTNSTRPFALNSINGSSSTPTNTIISGPPTNTFPSSALTFSISLADASSPSAVALSAETAVASLNVAGTSDFDIATGNGQGQLAIKVSELQSKISELETLLRLQAEHGDGNRIGNSSNYNNNNSSINHNSYNSHDYNPGNMNSTRIESYPTAGNRYANSLSSVTTASSPNFPFGRNVYPQFHHQQQQIPQQYKQQNWYQKLPLYAITDRPFVSQYGPRVDEFEATDFFNCHSSTVVRVNGMTNYKPMHTQYLFNSDTFFNNSRIYMNSLYREMKRLLKDVTVQSDYSILTNPLATQLNENFKVAKLLFIVNRSLNCESPMIDANSKLIASLFASRKSCSTNLPLIKLSYQNTEQARRALVLEIEQILPKSPAEIALLWDVYEKFVYPFLPTIDLPTFKRDIELIIVGLKLDWSSEQPIPCPHHAGNGSTSGGGCDAAGVVQYSVNLTSFIDLGLIANFLIILRLAYLSLKINTEFINTNNNDSFCNVEASIVNLDNLQHIGANYISVAFMCLSQARCLTKNSLSVLNALLYMHFYMVHSEEFSGSSDETERLSLLGHIESMALTVGIYRDIPGVVIFNQGKNHPGVDFYNKTKLTHLTRTLWHFVKKIDTMEFLTSGHPVTAFITRGRKVELPIFPKTTRTAGTAATSASPSSAHDNDEKYDATEDEEKLNSLINNNVIRQSKVSHWLTAVSRNMHEHEKMRIIDVFGFVNEMPEMIFAQFGNPEQYFVNNLNFGKFGQEKRNGKGVTQETKDNNEKGVDDGESISIGATNTDLYYTILDKVMQFEHYVTLMTASFKLNGLLLYYYEDKQDLHNYSYVVKEVIFLLSSFTRTVMKEYMVNNINFLSIDKDPTMKNFNSKLMPMVGRLAQCALALCGSILFRLFVAVHHFSNQLVRGTNNDSNDNNFNSTAGLRNFYNIGKQEAKLGAFIALKKNLIKVFEITTKGHFYKVLKFYFQSIKVSAFFGLMLSEFKIRDADNDVGRDKRIFNFFFDKQTKDEIKAMRYPNSVNENNTENNTANNMRNGNSKNSNNNANIEGNDNGTNNNNINSGDINDNRINFDGSYSGSGNDHTNNATEEQPFEFKDAPESLVIMKMTGEQIAELNSILSETGLSVPIGFIGNGNGNGNGNEKDNVGITSNTPTDRSYSNSSINNSSNVNDQSHSYLDELVDYLLTNTLYDTWTDKILLEDIERNCRADVACNGP